MTTALLISGLVAIVAFAIWLALRSARREGASSVERDIAQDLARKADKNAQIAGENRTAADVDKRLSDGTW